ncbi:hypothetical protein EVAR_41916_1 [Eumeta japonica]|uniref:Uncharacterized protein n=1 Tax=Eumeta variegata TaxID=151549 RepID=A0A4C1XIS7_EUMVA|nr:hypothetical protein EVAR_41916_1 [Eumeta japonica]
MLRPPALCYQSRRVALSYLRCTAAAGSELALKARALVGIRVRHMSPPPNDRTCAYSMAEHLIGFCLNLSKLSPQTLSNGRGNLGRARARVSFSVLTDRWRGSNAQLGGTNFVVTNQPLATYRCAYLMAVSSLLNVRKERECCDAHRKGEAVKIAFAIERNSFAIERNSL